MNLFITDNLISQIDPHLTTDTELMVTYIEYQILKQRSILRELLQTQQQLLISKNISPQSHSKIPIQLKSKITSTTKNAPCQARIYNGKQCSRRCKDPSSEFCGNHLLMTPFGRIGEDLPNLAKQIKSRTRGRQSTNTQNTDIANLDLSQYIKTQQIIINGQDYLIDAHGVVFTTDNSNTITALKTGDNQYQWFDCNYLTEL